MRDIFIEAYDEATREIRKEEKNGNPVEYEDSNDAAKEAKNRLWAEIANVMRDLSDEDRFDVAKWNAERAENHRRYQCNRFSSDDRQAT